MKSFRFGSIVSFIRRWSDRITLTLMCQSVKTREEDPGDAVDEAEVVEAADEVHDAARPARLEELLGKARHGEQDEGRHHDEVLDALPLRETDRVFGHRFTSTRQRWRRICRQRPPMMKGMKIL